ncbi:MAG: hypothetical protein ABTQ93_12865 [Candidatus Competibacter denitrificans]
MRLSHAAGSSSGVVDHGALTGLGDDDHPQYHTDARGDARYEPKSAAIQTHIASTANPHSVTAAQTGAYTSGQTDALLAGKAAASHSHAIGDVASLQTGLDGKAATAHSHTSTAISDFSEAVDDRVAALLTAGTNVTMTYDDAANTLTIAATGGGVGGTALKGSIAEVIAVSGAITTDTRQHIEGYLAKKWGLLALLPANHPYKSGKTYTLAGHARFSDGAVASQAWCWRSDTGAVLGTVVPSPVDGAFAVEVYQPITAYITISKDGYRPKTHLCAASEVV